MTFSQFGHGLMSKSLPVSVAVPSSDEAGAGHEGLSLLAAAASFVTWPKVCNIDLCES